MTRYRITGRVTADGRRYGPTHWLSVAFGRGSFPYVRVGPVTLLWAGGPGAPVVEEDSPPPVNISTSIKGTVTAVDITRTPTTISVLSGDTTIDGVRFIDSYTPSVGDTVLLSKQDTDIVAFGVIHDGDEGGVVYLSEADEHTPAEWKPFPPATAVNGGVRLFKLAPLTDDDQEGRP